jgi:general secretion pathway protein D
VKKTAALLLAGLVSATVLYAEEKPAAPPASPPGASDKIDVRKLKAGDDYVTLNFTNIDISALVKVMSELMRRNFILDERVTGKVTLMTPTKISPDEAYQVFLAALEMKGFTAVEDGKITRIIPAASARQSGLKVFKDDDFKGQGFITKLLRLAYVNPNELVKTLSPLISKDGNMIAYPATNSLIITDAVHNIRKMESLISSLDIPTSEGKGKINVYYLKHANAEDFAKVMTSLVSRIPVPSAGGAAAAQAAGPATILEGQVTMAPDKATNSLIVVASPGDYETIKDVIQKLDIRRRQVYVEAAIIEMSLSKQRELGFEYQAVNYNTDTNKTSVIGGTNFGTIGTVAASGPAGLAGINGLTIGAIKGTFSFNGVDYLSVGALLHALQTDSNVNVLSTPNILTMDNQKAEIMVGQNVPFVTGQSQSATTGGNVQTLIDRKDVGISLKLTPQITSDDNVRLDVYQEISDVITTTGLNPNVVGPTTSKRSASTTVVVKDGQTMVIGGLIRDNVTSSTSKVPFLGDIPILGWLFKSKSTKVEKTNLMIFITPYIIKNESDASEITKRKEEGLEQFRKAYSIEKKSEQPTQISVPPATEAAPGKIEQQENQQLQSAPTSTLPAEEAPSSSPEVRSAPTGTTTEIPMNDTMIQSTPTGTAPVVPQEAPR